MKIKVLCLIFLLFLISCNDVNSIDHIENKDMIIDIVEDSIYRCIDYKMGVVCYIRFSNGGLRQKEGSPICMSCIPISDIKDPFIQNVYDRIHQEKRN